MPQTVATERFRFALSWNVTTGWRRVCHFVHCAGDWRRGLPSQITGCCPKSAAHCHIAPRTENQGQQRTIESMLYCWCCAILCRFQPTLSTNRQWFCRFPVLTQRNCVNFYSLGYATVEILRRLCRGVFLHSLGQLCAWIVHLCWGNPNIRLDVIERNEAMLQAVKPLALKRALKCSLLISDQVGYYLSWRAW